jgi:hypothetical protein
MNDHVSTEKELQIAGLEENSIDVSSEEWQAIKIEMETIWLN